MPGNAVLQNLTRIIALVGIFAWGLLALVEGNLRRLLLFAVTSQAGFVLLGATFSWQTALFHLVSSTVAFLALFLCCGSIGNKLNTNSIEEMDGLSKRMPGQAIVFLLAGLWLSGLPPFGNFFSKYMLGIEAGEASMTFSILIAAAAILTLGYFLRPLRIFLHGEG
jgi:NADH-quinone oxidoreductase subunit L